KKSKKQKKREKPVIEKRTKTIQNNKTNKKIITKSKRSKYERQRDSDLNRNSLPNDFKTASDRLGNEGAAANHKKWVETHTINININMSTRGSSPSTRPVDQKRS
ncbi:MAG: hypothetical protein AAGJ35_09145, partial [Myxococcota bacterium]